MRVPVGWRSASRENYKDFCKKHPSIKLTYEKWCSIIYGFNESFRDYILETGEKARFPGGFGDFSISKKKSNKIKVKDGKEYINLPIDWKKSREKGKHIYLMNFHTEGFLFGWLWFKKASMIKFRELWYFKPSRVSSRLIAHYLKVNNDYQHIYREWRI